MASDVLLLVLLVFSLAAARHPRSALYPATLHPKWQTPWLLAHSFQTSVEDVELLFEILLSGMEILGKDPPVIPDAELASLRGARSLELICDGVLPKSLPEVLRLAAGLDERRRPMSAPDFERTVLTLVYAAQTAARADGTERRQAWAGSLVRLFRAIRKDLAL
ncbi:protein FAM180A [Phyllopteryx taeniolatus]|uniref:protein FAM180A n=1 Tax=Phyllopteryx taeniolatus TaxID=161469 RepID=UPI002AD2AB0E|nr:protein FAM180A [Phyllopteryx taeniolatus]